MKFTVLGASGFVGSSLVARLKRDGATVVIPSRDELKRGGNDTGHLVYCIGFTGNFRAHLPETIDAHVTQLKHCLSAFDFSSFLFMSSTRVYGGAKDVTETNEDCAIPVVPSADSVYDLSKLLGEALCLSRKEETVRVARLSNVVGQGMSRHTFLGSILEDLNQGRPVRINESPDSSKDYIAIDDVVDLLVRIATAGTSRVYNVASGRPFSHQELSDTLAELGERRVTFAPGGPRRAFPQIDASRITSEFGIKPRGIEPALLSRLLTASAVEP